MTHQNAPFDHAERKGWNAAVAEITSMVARWRDENRASAAEARKHGNRSMADMLNGSATECHALIGELEKMVITEGAPS